MLEILATFLSMNLVTTIMFVMMKHPLSMGMMLMIQTITISMITGNFSQTTWFSYILFLIMVGGMLILFMYMTSVASNEKFKANPKLIMIIPPTITLMFMMNKTMMSSYMLSETLPTVQAEQTNMLLNKFINAPMLLTLMFLMIYLLLALIATVKITNFKQGPIRQMS